MSELVFRKSSVAPSAPGFGEVTFYVKTDGKLYMKDENGVETPVASGGSTGSSTFIGLTDVPASYAGMAGKVAAVNSAENGLVFIDPPSGGGTGDVQKFEFIINFGASNPASITGLPTGWASSISSADVTIVHTTGKPPVSIHYYGLGTLNGQPTWRYRLPSAANEMVVPDANKNSEFTFRINTSVAAADSNSQARIVVLF